MKKYEEPNMELVMYIQEDIITISNGGYGEGENVTGPWGS